MAGWAEIEAQITADTIRHVGEQIRLEPMRHGAYSGAVADPSRPVIEGAALVDEQRGYGAEIPGIELRVNYDEVRIELPRTLLPEGWDIQTDDRLTLIERPGPPTYAVSRVDIEGTAAVSLTLSPIGDTP